MRSAFKAALQQETDFRSKLQFPLMTQTLPKTEMPQAKQPQVAFQQETSGKRHVSYGRKDNHIKATEERLMSKYHMGYSQLHKYLVLKEGNSQFATPYL